MKTNESKSFKTWDTLTHISGTYANSADPDQIPHSVVSDQGLHCWLTEYSIKFEKKMKNTTLQPLIQKWTGPTEKSRDSIPLKWVKKSGPEQRQVGWEC